MSTSVERASFQARFYINKTIIYRAFCRLSVSLTRSLTLNFDPLLMVVSFSPTVILLVQNSQRVMIIWHIIAANERLLIRAQEINWERERARMACKLNKPLLFVVLFFFIRFMYNHNNSIGNNNNNNGSIVFLRKILWLLLFFSCLVLTKWFLVMMTTNKTGSSQNEWKLPSKSMMVGEKYYAMGKMDWLIQWRGHAERMNERVSEYLIKCRPP